MIPSARRGRSILPKLLSEEETSGVIASKQRACRELDERFEKLGIWANLYKLHHPGYSASKPIHWRRHLLCP
jgi:hypothetical protein